MHWLLNYLMKNVLISDRSFILSHSSDFRSISQLKFSDIRGGMGKAGIALKQVLEIYGISQYKLAAEMKISRSNIHRWVYEQGDPAGDSILEIRDALQKISPDAAAEFILLYLEQAIEDKNSDG